MSRFTCPLVSTFMVAAALLSSSARAAPQSADTETVTIDFDKPFDRYHRIKDYPRIPPIDTSNAAPPRPGQNLLDQKLIERYRPPILDYEIPPQWQGMKIACGERSQNMREEAAATCAPILDMAKLFVQLEYAMNDTLTPYGRDPAHAEATRRDALAFANKIITAYATPEWPLQYRMLSETYRIRSDLYKESGKFDAAIADQDARIRLLHGPDKYESTTSSHEGDSTSSTDLANAYWEKGELLLAKKDRAAARKNYAAANAALNPKDMFIIFSPIRYHTEIMVHDALLARDYDQALAWIDDYLARFKKYAPEYGESADISGEISLQQLLAYEFFAYFSKGNHKAALDTLALYEKTETNSSPVHNHRCAKPEVFAKLSAPYKDPATLARLKNFACDTTIAQALAPLLGLKQSSGAYPPPLS